MTRQPQSVDIEIDKLTNSIENAFSGNSFETVALTLEKAELTAIKKGNG